MLREGYTLASQSRPSTIGLWTRNGAVEPDQNLWASSTLVGSKTTQPLETYSRSEQTKPFGDHQDHPPTMGVGYLIRFQGRLLPYT